MQTRRGDDAAASVLRALYTAVFAPVQTSAALRGVRRLVIVPHGVLTYLPFSALLDARANEYLVERYSLLHASTASAFVAMRSATAATTDSDRAVAAVFSPFPDELPATREESRTFLVAVTPSEAHLGRNATERRLRAALESGGIVHVATHAVMNARNPLFSRIELAGDRGATSSDDSRLEIHELLGLRSSSPLVFLSGCETALGAAGSTPFDAAEDYTTIGQALLYAGARNVVATLWRIDDSAAAELARRFYEALGTSTVVESLAKAQRAMIADPSTRRPYLWASYQVSGAGTERILSANGRVASDKR
jgi:CHAT domain-containing protein